MNTDDHDMNESEYAAYKRGYQAGLAKVQADDDDAFWLRQYAGQAMQGILAADTQSLLYPYQIVQRSIDCAKALLEEVKRGVQ